MALEKQDLQDIKGVLEEVVEEKIEPYFHAIQKDFSNVYERFDRLEGLIQDDYKRRIEKLEEQMKELRDALLIKPKLA